MMLVMPFGFTQRLQRATVTRALATGPDKSRGGGGGFTKSCFSPKGCLPGDAAVMLNRQPKP